MSGIKYTRSLLSDAAAQSTSLSDMLRRLGRDPRSGSLSCLRRKLTEFGIDTSRFQSKHMVCSKELLEEAVAASTSVAGVPAVSRPSPSGRNTGARGPEDQGLRDRHHALQAVRETVLGQEAETARAAGAPAGDQPAHSW